MGTPGGDLIRVMAAGDRDAFARFYDRYAPLVFPFVLRIVRDRADAADVLQDVFWEAWRGAAAYDSARGTPEAWIITRARTRAIDRVRAVRRRGETFVAAVDEATVGAPTPPGGDAAVRAEERQLVASALAQLSEAQRGTHARRRPPRLAHVGGGHGGRRRGGRGIHRHLGGRALRGAARPDGARDGSRQGAPHPQRGGAAGAGRALSRRRRALARSGHPGRGSARPGQGRERERADDLERRRRRASLRGRPAARARRQDLRAVDDHRWDPARGRALRRRRERPERLPHRARGRPRRGRGLRRHAGARGRHAGADGPDRPRVEVKTGLLPVIVATATLVIGCGREAPPALAPVMAAKVADVAEVNTPGGSPGLRAHGPLSRAPLRRLGYASRRHVRARGAA